MSSVAPVISVTIDRAAHTVLVVDDHPATRYATARVLRGAGFKTAEAANGQEALDLAMGGVSAVVLDVHLPDIDGFTVCRTLRAQPETVVLPIIHLSATYVQDADKVAGLNAGADAYLVHPAEPMMLVATVQALIRARMAEEGLRSSEEKFRTIYTQAGSGIALVDPEGRFHDANPAMLAILGQRTGDVIGRCISDFATPDCVERVRQLTTLAGGTEQQQWVEHFELVNGKGEPVHLEWSMSPQVDNDLRIAVVTNVSERIQLDLQRQKLFERERAARSAAERHSRTKDDFVAVLSHELRNPLSAIMMNVHVLSRLNAPAEFARGLEAIRRNANTQARIISDILDVSRINSGKLALERELVEPAPLVESSLESMKPLVDKKQLQVTSAVDGTIPAVWLDAARFQQIFWNIFNNAIKFSEIGGEVQVRLAYEGGMLTLAVRDFGKGIAPDFIDRIFDKFTQSDAPGNRQHGGLGLGLSIVKHLVELHGGQIGVSSLGLGQGTTVQVQIPAEAPDGTVAGNAQLSVPAPLESGNFETLRGLSILVVEDDEEAGELLALILRERGATVVLAADHGAALAQFDAARPGMLISDIGLPGKDGYELIRDLRARELVGPRTPAIALTAFGREDDQRMATAAGFDVHLSKPLDPHVLLGAIAKLRSGQA